MEKNNFMYLREELKSKIEHEVKFQFRSHTFTVDKLLTYLKMNNSYSWGVFYDIFGMSPGKLIESNRLML